jgi:hypothetical protein
MSHRRLTWDNCRRAFGWSPGSYRGEDRVADRCEELYIVSQRSNKWAVCVTRSLRATYVALEVGSRQSAAWEGSCEEVRA